MAFKGHCGDWSLKIATRMSPTFYPFPFTEQVQFIHSKIRCINYLCTYQFSIVKSCFKNSENPHDSEVRMNKNKIQTAFYRERMQRQASDKD